jgi:hypothetical protein
VGASGLLALSLVAATSVQAWPSGPVVPTEVAAASARVAWICAAVRVSVHSWSYVAVGEGQQAFGLGIVFRACHRSSRWLSIRYGGDSQSRPSRCAQAATMHGAAFHN